MIAVSSGQGKLLRVSLELVDACMETASSDVPLAVADADVVVKIQNQKVVDVKNDFIDKSVDKNNLSNIALQDDQSYFGKPVVSNGKFDPIGSRNSVTSRDRYHTSTNRIIPHHLTPLEVGMYILLAVFCAAIAIFVASCFVYASKFRRQDYPLQTKSQSVQNAHDWVWLGKSNRQSAECGSEMNITTNPRSDEVFDDHFSGTNSTSTKSRTRTMASGHVPPPGHPAHGSPPFQQVTPEMIRFGPYQQSHRYHQQMLMQRPHRFLPATPMNQRLSPVYQNNNNLLMMAELEEQKRIMEEEDQRRLKIMADQEMTLSRRFNDATMNVIQNPMESADEVVEVDDFEEQELQQQLQQQLLQQQLQQQQQLLLQHQLQQQQQLQQQHLLQQQKRPKIDSATYTKKNLTYFDDEYDRGRLILPVGYPYYVNNSPKVAKLKYFFI